MAEGAHPACRWVLSGLHRVLKKKKLPIFKNWEISYENQDFKLSLKLDVWRNRAHTAAWEQSSAEAQGQPAHGASAGTAFLQPSRLRCQPCVWVCSEVTCPQAWLTVELASAQMVQLSLDSATPSSRHSGIKLLGAGWGGGEGAMSLEDPV